MIRAAGIRLSAPFVAGGVSILYLQHQEGHNTVPARIKASKPALPYGELVQYAEIANLCGKVSN